VLAAPAAEAPPGTDDDLHLEQHVRRVEVRLIRAALNRSGGNRTQAARLLGISRNGLALKIEKLGITD
jgi:DNA-binding NtrC family response regulator